MNSLAWRPLWPNLETILRSANGGRLPAGNSAGWIGPIRSPLREDAHPSFSVRPDTESSPGGWIDHATGETGSIAELARLLDVSPANHLARPERPGSSLAAFADERGLDLSVLRQRWGIVDGTKDQRRGIVYPTRLGVSRIKFLDGRKPKYSWLRPGGEAHWYGMSIAKQTDGETLHIVNGEPSVWAATQSGVPAVCLCAGEGVLPSVQLVEELKRTKFSRFVVVYDLDAAGQGGSRRLVQALQASGLDATAVALPADLGPGGDVDDLHRRAGDSGLAKALEDLPLLPSANDQAASAAVTQRAPQADHRVPWPEPLAGAALHGLAGDFVRLVLPHTEADPAALLLQFLAAFGSCVGSGPFFRIGGDSHYPRLFVVVVGSTARGRKGSSWNLVRALFKFADPDWTANRVQAGLSSGEGLIWAVRDPVTRPGRSDDDIDFSGRLREVLVDPGVTDKRLLVVEGEFASVLKVVERDGNTLSPVVRLAWDTGDLRVITKNSPAVATGAHVALIGHITVEELRRRLCATEIFNGLANRFLWACTKRSKLLPDGGSLDLYDLERLAREVRRLLPVVRAIAEVRRSPEATELWRSAYIDLAKDVPGHYGAVIARAEAQVIRLSLVYALLDGCRQVQLPHLEAALAVWTFADASARFLFGEALTDPLADKILTLLLASADGLTRTEISRSLNGHHDSSRLSSTLDRLAQAGLAAASQDTSSGRSATRWRAVRHDQNPAPADDGAEDENSEDKALDTGRTDSPNTLLPQFVPPENGQPEVCANPTDWIPSRRRELADKIAAAEARSGTAVPAALEKRFNEATNDPASLELVARQILELLDAGSK